MIENIKKLSVDIFVAVLNFFAIVGTSVATDVYGRYIALHKANMGDLLEDRFFAVWNFVILLFLAFSVIRTTYVYRLSKKAAYLDSHEGKGTLIGSCAKVLRSADFWIPYAVLAVAFFHCPMEFVLCHIKNTFLFGMQGSDFEIRRSVCFILAPILLILQLLAYLSSRKEWRLPKEFSVRAESKPSKIRFIWMLFGVCIFYFLASCIAPFLIPAAISVYNIVRIAWDKLLLCGLVIFLLAYMPAALRALRKQRRFMKSLRKACLEHSYTLTVVKNPHLSICCRQKGYHFSVKAGDKEYRCKLVSGTFKGTPMTFTEKGSGVRLHTFRLLRVEFFHIMSRFDYSFESREKKVVIVLPSPAKVFAGEAGTSRLRPLDTGEILGDYQIFSGSGFLGALERNCIGVYRS